MLHYRCEIEINKYCNHGKDREGKTLHCLMEHANPRERQRQKVNKDEDIPEFSDQCKAAVSGLHNFIDSL